MQQAIGKLFGRNEGNGERRNSGKQKIIIRHVPDCHCALDFWRDHSAFHSIGWVKPNNLNPLIENQKQWFLR